MQTFRKELWFNIYSGGAYDLYVQWRGGNTVKELIAESWKVIGNMNLEKPEPPALFIDEDARYHQIRYGTDAADEPFSISWLEIVYDYTGTR